MKSPLWINKYKPHTKHFSQNSLKKNIKIALNSRMNLLITGAKGVGKTATANAIARKMHENPDNDVKLINISDVFNRTKKEILDDPRFESFISNTSQYSKRNLINKVIKQIASYPPVTGGYKTIILDSSENARDDFQHSLRRTMETYSESTHFIITTRNPSDLINPIRSRCYRVHINPPDIDEIMSIVDRISDEEKIEYSEEGIEYVWSQTRPNIRKFLLLLQTVHINKNFVGIEESSSVQKNISKSNKIFKIIGYAEDNNYREVKSKLENLIEKEGYSPKFLLELIVEESIRNLKKEDYIRMCQLAQEADIKIEDSVDEKVPVIDMLSKWSSNQKY